MKKKNTTLSINIVLLIISLFYITLYNLILINVLTKQYNLLYEMINTFFAIPVFYLTLSFIITLFISKKALKENLKLPYTRLKCIAVSLIIIQDLVNILTVSVLLWEQTLH